MNVIDRFKSLPQSSRRLLSLGIILALVVALPLFIWSIVNQKFLFSKKAATGEPNSLAITTDAFIDGAVGVDYRNFFYGEEYNYSTDPQLTLTATNLPPGLSVPAALCGTSYPTDRGTVKRTECALNGIPTVAGNYSVNVTLSDNFGNSISRDVPISILSTTPTPTPTAAPTIIPSPTPTATPTGSPSPFRSFNIFLKLDGVSDNSANGATATVRFISNSLNNALGYITSPISMTYLTNGVYQMSFTLPFNQLPADNDYAIIIKGEKHLATRFCVSSGQTQHCSGGDPRSIVLTQTSNTLMPLDFTGIPLEPGDLFPQDGVVDGNDFNKIKDLLSKPCANLTDQDKLVGDVDYSGCVNAKDAFLVRKTLQTRYDEN